MKGNPLIKTRLVIVLTSLGLFMMMLSGASFGLAKFLQTDPSGFMAIDPIVNRGQAVSPHDHTFQGSTKLMTMPSPENAGYSDLVGQGTAIGNPDDTAAYWTPTLVYISGPNAGKNVPVKSFRAYYRCFNHDNVCGSEEKVIPYPNDLRLVAGNAAQPASIPNDTKLVNWMCDQRSSRPGPYPDIQTARCDLATGTVFLTGHVDFPTCWNGQLADHTGTGNTSDNAHVKFVENGACPAGYPNRFSELRIDIKYDYRGNGSDVALSSDIVQRNLGNPVKSGQTLHADFLNSWLPTGGVHGGLKGMIDACVNSSPESWCLQ